MQEVGDHYIRVDILLPRRSQMERGYVVAGRCNANKHVMESLDTIMYQVEFAGAKLQS